MAGKERRITIDDQRFYIVQNTSQYDCPCKSWLEYYNTSSGISEDRVYNCAVNGCRHRAEHGAHVEFLNINGRYILPLCPFHNTQDKIILYAKFGLPIISAGRKKRR